MFQEFKPILKILLRFLLIYLILLGIYQLYLNYFQPFGLDPISKQMAVWVSGVQNALGYETLLYDDQKGKRVWYYVSGEYRTVMVEGCNAISVIILFLAFIFAFYKGAKTFIFAVLSVAIMLILNVLRISGLNIIFVEIPKYGKAAHDYWFPAVIYGSVVFFWLIWIKFFVLKDEK